MKHKTNSKKRTEKISGNTYVAPTFIGFRPDADDKKNLKSISEKTGSKRSSELIRQALKTKADSLN